MKRIFISILLSASIFYQAASASSSLNFSGDWLGKGEMTTSRGEKTPCSKIRIKITHDLRASPEKLTIELYDALCGMIAPDWGPYPFEIRDGKVFANDEEVGTLDRDLFKTLLGGGAQYAVNMRFVPGGDPSKDILRSYYGVKNGFGVIVIEGDLQRAERFLQSGSISTPNPLD